MQRREVAKDFIRRGVRANSILIFNNAPIPKTNLNMKFVREIHMGERGQRREGRGEGAEEREQRREGSREKAEEERRRRGAEMVRVSEEVAGRDGIWRWRGWEINEESRTGMIKMSKQH